MGRYLPPQWSLPSIKDKQVHRGLKRSQVPITNGVSFFSGVFKLGFLVVVFNCGAYKHGGKVFVLFLESGRTWHCLSLIEYGVDSVL